MTIAVAVLARAFKYNSLDLPDPGPNKTPDEVRAIYSAHYPELNTAVVEGPVTKNGVSTYTFARAAGAKGATHLQGLQRIVDGKVKTRKGDLIRSATPQQLDEAQKCSMTVMAVLGGTKRSSSLVPPAAAFSLFG
jgi:PRTRC genetic system protein C